MAGALEEGPSAPMFPRRSPPRDVKTSDRDGVHYQSRPPTATVVAHYALRRPETRVAFSFWYNPWACWSTLLATARDVSTMDPARGTLHRYGVAGRITEVEAGVAPMRACATCVRASAQCEGHEKLGGPYASCRVTDRPGCTYLWGGIGALGWLGYADGRFCPSTIAQVGAAVSAAA